MLEKYLYKEWNKIEYTTRVLSIKNICNKLSLIYGKPSETFVDFVKQYFVENKDAIFVNGNQIIDKKTLINKNINSLQELYNILLNEYFVMDIDIKFLSLDIIKPKKAETDIVKYLPFPEELFNNFYKATNILNDIKDNDNEKANVIFNYLSKQKMPANIYDIYLNLTGALIDITIRDLFNILNNCRNFVHYKEYWTVKGIKRTFSEQIQLNQWLHTRLLKRPSYELVNTYIDNVFDDKMEISIDKVIDDVEILGIEISKKRIEDLLIERNYTEVFPGCWLIHEELDSLGRFSLKKQWELTCSSLLKSIKNKRNIDIFYRRILKGETLGSIGDSLDITRERVRQIEKKIRKKMTHRSYSKYIRPFYNWFIDKLKLEKIIDLSTIGITEEEYRLFDLIINNYFENKNVCRIMDGIVIFKPEYERIITELNKITIDSKIISLEEIPFASGFSKHIDNYIRVLQEYIGMTKIDENKYFYTGKKPTNEEEIYIIIYKSGRPLHYSEVEVAAEKFKLPLSTEPGRNTLATMQRDNLLRRVAPGTYGLKEWGIPKHIYITDLIYKVLEEAGRPLYYEELFSEVKRRRFDKIKERSVQYYLATHEEVAYIYTKQYILTEWVDEPERLAKYGVDITKIQNDTLLYNNKVILDVIKLNEIYITKYKLSEACKKSSSLRISRHVNFNFDRRIVVIDRNEKLHFQSYSSDTITGINRWTCIPDIDEVFYMEFINEKVARFLSVSGLNEYKPIEENLLLEAEEFWTRSMEELLENEEKDEEIIDEILSKESLLAFGLEKGYVYYETIEKLVDLGYNPRELLYELNDRGIIVNY